MGPGRGAEGVDLDKDRAIFAGLESSSIQSWRQAAATAFDSGNLDDLGSSVDEGELVAQRRAGLDLTGVGRRFHKLQIGSSGGHDPESHEPRDNSFTE